MNATDVKRYTDLLGGYIKPTRIKMTNAFLSKCLEEGTITKIEITPESDDHFGFLNIVNKVPVYIDNTLKHGFEIIDG